MTSPEPGRRPETTGLPRVLGLLAEGVARDLIVDGALGLSLVVVVYGVIVGGAGWIALGVVVGVLGAGFVLVSRGKKWSIPRMWAVLLVVYLVDVATLIAMGLLS